MLQVPPVINKYPVFYSSRGVVPSPLLTVDWHSPTVSGYDPTDVTVEISAVSGELLQLTEGTVSFSKEHLPLVHDLDKLEAISDAEFLKYSPMERSNLVVRFSNVHHPSPVIPHQPWAGLLAQPKNP